MTTALIVLLVVYTAVGAIQAFNLFNASDRLARHFGRYPRILRGYRADDPSTHRAGGLIILATGGLVLGWLAFGALGSVPILDKAVAAALLAAVALAGVAAWLVLRTRTR